MDDWKYIFIEQPENATLFSRSLEDDPAYRDYQVFPSDDGSDPDAGLTKKRGADWEIPPITLPPSVDYQPASISPSHCDSDYPRIFHMFWTGPFTDKPYLAILDRKSVV